jgi:hypothetical protein
MGARADQAAWSDVPVLLLLAEDAQPLSSTVAMTRMALGRNITILPHPIPAISLSTAVLRWRRAATVRSSRPHPAGAQRARPGRDGHAREGRLSGDGVARAAVRRSTPFSSGRKCSRHAKSAPNRRAARCRPSSRARKPNLDGSRICSMSRESPRVRCASSCILTASCRRRSTWCGQRPTPEP